MLQLKSIYKGYVTGGFTQVALKNVSLSFRTNEFVAILGPSGSGKTTLLNIVGGLDQYDRGDLVIDGVSTTRYTDRDWDTYRNNRIGFIFQSYNLIPHQSVLSNVELALTLSGVSKEERKRRATEALVKVGLEDHINKKPNQLSGGQMQRVAIARALVNDPDIVLADEPTGALDSKTSVSIMDLLTEIAKDRLVVMVTHNPDLADTYATRIVSLSDGEIVSDSNPFDPEKETSPEANKPKHTSMSFFTALSLSFANLMTKKGRTIMTALAGSIGIIGIALILALANGVNNYIETVEEDTLSEYPLSIGTSGFDMSSLISADRMGSGEVDPSSEEGIRIAKTIGRMLSSFSSNDLAALKKYMEEHESDLAEYIKSIEYSYNVTPLIYDANTTDGVYQVNPDKTLSAYGAGAYSYGGGYISSYFSTDVFKELPFEKSLYENQYDMLAGRWPEATDEMVLVLNRRGYLSDYDMYVLGLRDRSELAQIIKDFSDGEAVDTEDYEGFFTYDDIFALEFKLVNAFELYSYDETYGVWVDKSEDKDYMKALIARSKSLKIVGIVTANESSNASMLSSGVYYSASLAEEIVDAAAESAIVKAQQADPDTDVFSGQPFEGDGSADDFDMSSLYTIDTELMAQAFVFNPVTMQMEIDPEKFSAAFKMNLTRDELIELMTSMATSETASYEANLVKLGYYDLSHPTGIDIYPYNFEAKEKVIAFLDDYNAAMEDADTPEKVITYTDIVGTLMSSVTEIVDTISAVLVAFVAISLVVSSIMIGIITYISVLERRKEIGILRAIGASKRDISRVFNAETVIEGFAAGLLGVGISALICLPANLIGNSLLNVYPIAILPLDAAAALIAISIVLTFIGGLIPANGASRRDPVEALRSE
ncbi:MAG: ABC transporter ATP-binding protein/permease [Eggerthellaceae bacterium]|nr:ABC transporter ATP-binding protein/permease [Eggerthellaceae bacterium]